MSRNPILPYGLIAVIGILTVIIISYVGVNHRHAAENEGNEQEVAVLDAEAIFKNQCASCHGDDLSGNTAPALSNVGNTLTEDEIKEIIIHGTDNGMPGGLVDNEQAELIAEWLSEMQQEE